MHKKLFMLLGLISLSVNVLAQSFQSVGDILPIIDPIPSEESGLPYPAPDASCEQAAKMYADRVKMKCYPQYRADACQEAADEAYNQYMAQCSYYKYK